MTTLGRRIRAGLVNASFWGVGWFAIGLALHVILHLLSGSSVYFLSAVVQAAVMGGFGFFLGGAFSLYVARAFRHSRIERISMGRFALGGGLVTALIELATLYALNLEQVADEVLTQPAELYGSILQTLALAGCLGGLTAWGTLRLARAGSDLDRLVGRADSPSALPGAMD